MADDFTDLFQGFDESFIAEFMDELREACSDIESLLLELEERPRDRPLVDDLFRRVHSIKSNLRMVGFDAIAEFVHAVEEVLDAVRHDQLAFDKGVSEVVLLSVDRAQATAEAMFRGNSALDADTVAVQERLVRIGRGEVSVIPETIGLLDPARAPEQKEVPPMPDRQRDLHLFAALAGLLEQRTPGWSGRYGRLLEMAQDLNEEAGQPVDPLQLEAAVCLCDIARVSLAEVAVPREASPDAPLLAAQVLSAVDGWEEAATILRQHREREDGSGSPAGLRGEAIVPGARILAVADAFDTAMREQSEGGRRSLLRVAAEINGAAGTRFSPYWVETFNRVIRRKWVRRV